MLSNCFNVNAIISVICKRIYLRSKFYVPKKAVYKSSECTFRFLFLSSMIMFKDFYLFNHVCSIDCSKLCFPYGEIIVEFMTNAVIIALVIKNI